MREAFIKWRADSGSIEIVQAAIRICDEYAAAGYRLSLRQLYYQFVSKQPLTQEWANTERNYKRLGNIVSDARLAGLIDWDMIEDRGRSVDENAHWDNPADIVRACAAQFRLDLWADQPCYPLVMVEKQALEGVLEPVCRKLDIPFVANKGYSSSSALYGIGKRLGRLIRKSKECHVLYMGDHDPSGIDMTRDVMDRLQQFARSDHVVVHRLALNMDQVEQYNPPENPAKTTDSRAKDYIRKFGTSSWELDALDPTVLETLVRDFVEGLVDNDLMDAAVERQQGQRDLLTKMADKLDKEGAE